MTDQASAELDRLRKDIEGIDREIVALVARRLDLCRKVAPLKMSAGLDAHIPHRVQMVIDRWANHAVERGINAELMRGICGQIIAEGEKLQIEEMGQAAGTA